MTDLCQRLPWQATILLLFGQMKQKSSFLTMLNRSFFTDDTMKLIRKTVKHRVLLCCIWYWMPWPYHRNHEVRELSRGFRVKSSSQCKKTWFEPKILGPPARQRPKAYIQKYTRVVEKEKNILKWPAMSYDLSPMENLWGKLELAIGKNNPANIQELEQTAKEEGEKIADETWISL